MTTSLFLFFLFLVSACFKTCFNKNLLCDAAHALTVDASSCINRVHQPFIGAHPCMCANEWHPTASTLCPLSLPHRKAQVVSLGYAQNEAQMNHPQGRSFLTVGGFFECYTYHVMALGWLKKEERKKMNNSDF